MIGLLYIVFFGLYLWLSVKAVKFASRWAERHGRSPRLWGFIAGLAMYSLVFWDLIPTLALHRYYCASDAGFTLYQPLEQWKQAHPGIAGRLVPYDMLKRNPESLPPPDYLYQQAEQVDQWQHARRIDHYRYPSGIEVRVVYETYKKGEEPPSNKIEKVEVITPGVAPHNGHYLNRRFAWLVREVPHWFHILETDERIVDLETGEVLARYVDFSTDIRALGLGPRGMRDYKPWLMRRSCETGDRMREKERFNDISSEYEDVRGS